MSYTHRLGTVYAFVLPTVSNKMYFPMLFQCCSSFQHRSSVPSFGALVHFFLGCFGIRIVDPLGWLRHGCGRRNETAVRDRRVPILYGSISHNHSHHYGSHGNRASSTQSLESLTHSLAHESTTRDKSSHLFQHQESHVQYEFGRPRKRQELIGIQRDDQTQEVQIDNFGPRPQSS